MLKDFSNSVLWFVLVQFGLTVGVPMGVALMCGAMTLLYTFRVLVKMRRFAISLLTED